MSTGVSSDVLILTRAEDVHAFAVADALGQRGLRASIVETDRVAVGGRLSWSLDAGPPGLLTDVYGDQVRVRDAVVVWCRRLNGESQLPEGLDDSAHDLVARDCRASLLGLVDTEFAGTYISHPEATRAAQNKLVQLRAAQAAGFRIPRTLVSSDPEAVRDFCERLGWRVVVKTVSGAGPRQPVMTGRVTPELLAPAAVQMCPAIYQELVAGDRHLRVNVFGRRVYTALLRTPRLDWRYPLDCEVEPYEIDDVTQRQLHDVLGRLGLRMGIFDLKITPEGDVTWLEVNPQGQFLWLEGLCGMPLRAAFADFVADEVEVLH